ncbi:MAG: Rrf2 family transcriptional regulator [bacterium]
MRKDKDYLLEQIVFFLKEGKASYASPINSDEIGKKFNITPSYVRKKIKKLKNNKVIGVRRGVGGGYFILNESFNNNF